MLEAKYRDSGRQHQRFSSETGQVLGAMGDTDGRQVDTYAADYLSIKEAQQRINLFIHKTPVLTSETLNAIAGKTLFFKSECFQKGGAFKFRGACNAILSLGDDQAAKGVVTHSSGNHAAAVALAAKLRGIPAYIIIPKNAPACKVENVKRYGGQVIWSEATMQSREEIAGKVQQDTGAVLIHPFNDKQIIRFVSVLFLDAVSFQLDNQFNLYCLFLCLIFCLTKDEQNKSLMH